VWNFPGLNFQLLECRTRVKLGEDLVQFLAAPKLLYTGHTDLGPCFLSGLTQFARFGPVGPGCMLVRTAGCHH